MSANGLSERLQTPISTAELQRRWGLIRQAMEREKIDVLLMQNNNDHMGGAVKWFTDMPATNGYPVTVVFPRDDEMTVVMQGPFGGDGRPPADIWRGVKRLLTTPSYESAHYTNSYDPELAAKGLEPYANATIGFVHVYQMSFALGDSIMRKFPNARYVDASEMVDRVKVIKSAEELELVKRAALMQDGAMKAAFDAVMASSKGDWAVWAEGTVGRYREGHSGAEVNGLVGLFQGGLDFRLGERVIFGVMVALFSWRAFRDQALAPLSEEFVSLARLAGELFDRYLLVFELVGLLLLVAVIAATVLARRPRPGEFDAAEPPPGTGPGEAAP